ncbi:MAG: dihydrolipoyl dehydrogenase [Chloroflexi bacterium]|nr:dihydrolipoyl dehydrogenase [Chloroflexota bacterium]
MDEATYDVVVIGSGSGNIIVSEALSEGLSVALIDRGPLGGTCLNLGCIPSKMLIFPADRIAEIREARKLGVRADITEIDFQAIMHRMRRLVSHDRASIRRGIGQAEGLDFYEAEGRFVDTYTLQVGDRRVTGKKIFIAAGARPWIPPIEGVDDIDYLTNESVLELEALPKSIVVVGGSYIGVEYAHFFEAMGAKVTLVEMLDRLVPTEEPEVSAVLQKRMSERMAVHTNTRVERFEVLEGGCRVEAQKAGGDKIVLEAERVMLAVGRRSNADILQVEKAGIETNDHGYIKVDDYLRTNVENIWAFGDIIGRQMFRHAANREAVIAWHNATNDHQVRMDFLSVPHAVFAFPQIASVGLTEEQARREFKVAIGRVNYADIAKGSAMMEEDGFAKIIVNQENGHILGLHVVGPFAPLLVQEVVTIMANAGTIDWLARAMHIHPAASELIGDLPYVLHAHG